MQAADCDFRSPPENGHRMDVLFVPCVFLVSWSRGRGQHRCNGSPKPYCGDVRRGSEAEQVSVTQDLGVDIGQSQGVPKAHLVRREHRPLQLSLQRIQDRYAAKPGARDQDTIRRRRTARSDLRVKGFYLLLEAHAVPIKLARRQVPPLAAWIV